MLVRPILLVEIDIIGFLIGPAQSLRLLCAKTGIPVSSRPGDRSLTNLNLVGPLVLFGEKISEFHVAHTQEAKGPVGPHHFREELRLSRARLAAILLLPKRACR